MSIKKMSGMVGAVAAAIAIVSGGVFAQDAPDTAYVPFVVNVNAAVNARQGENILPAMAVEAGKEATLAIPLEKNITSVTHRPRNAPGRASVIAKRNGKFLLDLPGQPYKNAEVSLYTISGKRVLRAKASASEASPGISRPSIAAGAYWLSVRGINGHCFASRLTHGGGSMNINITFGGENALAGPPVAAANAAPEPDGWTITVSAPGYLDSSYTLDAVKGVNPVQIITLNARSGGIDGGPLTYGGQTYRTVIIGGKRWMAENLNHAAADSSWCYNNSPDSCAKYGRLYTWNRAVSACLALEDGWRLPDTADWRRLAETAGGWETAGSRLKSQTGWRVNPGTSSTDEFGFSALPGGDRGYIEGSYYGAGISGHFWSATESDLSIASLSMCMYYNYDFVSRAVVNSKVTGYAVRCVQNGF